MQHNFFNFFFAFFLLLALATERSISVCAQDTTTEAVTSAPGNSETTSIVDSSEELAPTTSSPEDCGEGCTVTPAKDCQCNRSDANLRELCDQLTTTEGSGEAPSEPDGDATTEENTTKTDAEGDVEETTTKSSPAHDVETTIPPPIFECPRLGFFPHPSDCRRYFNCNQMDVLEALKATEQLCPTGLAFNTEFSSCMRDLSPCSSEHGGFECSQAGSFPDPNNDTNVYYRCVPHLNGPVGAYHKYIVKCGSGRIYMAQLGKCFVDLNAIGSFPPFGFDPLEPSDEQLVKMELKQWKAKEKAQLKEEKMKLKYEEKLKKEIAKKQAKEAKEKAKEEEKKKKELGIYESSGDGDYN